MSPLGLALASSSVAAPVLFGGVLLGVDVPLVGIAGGLAAHLGLVGLAVANPTWRAFGPAITACEGGVALTFDDGPDPVHTPRTLDLLREHGAVATFFVVGEMIAGRIDSCPYSIRFKRPLRAFSANVRYFSLPVTLCR